MISNTIHAAASRYKTILQSSWALFPGLIAAIIMGGLAFPVQGQMTQDLQELLNATNETEPETTAEQPEPSIEEQLETLTKKLEIARSHYENALAASEAEAARQFGVDAKEIQERNALLRSLYQAYQRNISVLEKLRQTRESRADLDAQIEAWQGFQDPPPYSIDFVDELRDQIHAEDVAMQAARDQLDVLEEHLDNLRQRVETTAVEHKEAMKALEDADAATDLRQIQWQADKSRIAHLAAQAILEAFEDEALALRESIEYHQAAKAFAKKKLAIAVPNAPFTPDELAKKLEDFEEALAKTEAELEEARNRKTAADEALANVREELRATRETSAAKDEDASKRQEEIARLERLLEVRQAQAETAAAEVDALQMLINIHNNQSSLWRERYEFAHTEDYAELDNVRRLLDERIQAIEGWNKYFDSNLRKTETLVRNLQGRLASWRPKFGDEALAREELEALERREEVFRRGVARINDVVRMLRHWRSEIEAQQRETSKWEAAVSIVWGFLKRAWSVWNYPFLTVQDSSITINKIMMALIILVAGLYLSRKVARRIRALVVSRFHADESFAASLEKGVYYALIVAVLLFALSMVEIPLTVFAFFGGALAIGVGFGAQTLINNFISGIIMLIERPIKVGDIVDVEGVRGRVVNIGSRCCQVKLFDGVDILVPNSVFLEQKVVNWTLSDTVLRFSIKVGVAYGSPTREVAQLIEKAVADHGKILKHPAPLVLFEDFGDSALIFSVYFWLEVDRPMDYRIVCSDVRFRIDRLFREAGITIAFPQQDVHIDSLGPLKVSWAEPGTTEQPKPEKPRLPGGTDREE
ncbi:MAG: mechanosensitive ion channel [Candidatus Hydrogenedentota bacterium]